MRLAVRIYSTLAIRSASLIAHSLFAVPSQASSIAPHKLELSRPIRPWEFLPATGTRAALFGNESGQMEAWIYPLKLLRDFRLVFHEGDHAIPAEVAGANDHCASGIGDDRV